MSYWTHITGTINVTIPHSCPIPKKVAEYIEWVFDELKKNNHFITGSERDCNCYVAIDNWNGWSSETYIDHTYENAVITLFGDFRDRYADQTHKEVVDFVNNLKRYVTLEEINLLMKPDCGDDHIYHLGNSVDELKTDNYVIYYFNEATWSYDNTDIHKKWEQWWRVRLTNWERFCSTKYYTVEKLKEVVECLSTVNDKIFNELLTSGQLDRKIEWEYCDRYIKWLLENKLKLPADLYPDYVEQMKKELEEENSSDK